MESSVNNTTAVEIKEVKSRHAVTSSACARPNRTGSTTRHRRQSVRSRQINRQTGTVMLTNTMLLDFLKQRDETGSTTDS
ncbi:hypothetical protein DPMN_125078 [Dreissena polymorpha]|uniref:Uncharacterized protein n=1 Tax=Dreissena polymorpha TaxID=45954 RepID=A0A9D4JUD3_DREPO|nr:hypothetical protein DPMN_125078 [Dreissena polymorpha]